MKRNSKPTLARLKELFHYDPITGLFTRLKVTANCVRVGTIAGTKCSDGYLSICIDGVSHKSHVLAWYYVYAIWPTQDIDHRNRVKDDNAIGNLREIPHLNNTRNTVNPKNNTSGVRGVGRTKDKWYAQVKVEYKTKHLGYYKDFDNAVCARLAAEQCLEWEGSANVSPAYKYVDTMQKHEKKRRNANR